MSQTFMDNSPPNIATVLHNLSERDTQLLTYFHTLGGRVLALEKQVTDLTAQLQRTVLGTDEVFANLRGEIEQLKNERQPDPITMAALREYAEGKAGLNATARRIGHSHNTVKAWAVKYNLLPPKEG